jgi:mRNA interferase RelE/StbE
MANYQVRLTSGAEKDFRKLDAKIKARIIKSILSLKVNHFPQQFKPLMGREIAQFRLRIGDWRVLYDVYDEDKVVLILKIGHRKDIYR